MRLYVLRHGQAEARATSDAQRALTEAGRQDVRRVVSAAQANIQGPARVWVSPYRRAQQTADIALGLLPSAGAVYTKDCLVPDADLPELYAQLQDCGVESVLLVSHQPLVGSLLDDLCGTDPGFHPMGTASLACAEFEVAARGMGALLWLRHKDDD